MKKFDVVGFSIGGIGNITLNTNNLIAHSDTIYSLVSSKEFPKYLSILGKEATDLTTFYSTGLSSNEVYNNIFNRIIADFDHDAWSRAVFVVEGNPQVYNKPVQLLRNEFLSKNIEFAIHPAISSIDTILIDLDIHIENGIQILDAGRTLAWKQEINPSMDCLLFQIAACSVNHFIRFREQPPEIFIPLSDYLLKYYQKNHPVIIIRSAVLNEEETLKINSTIGGFPDFADKIDYNCSLFIPKLANKEKLPV